MNYRLLNSILLITFLRQAQRTDMTAAFDNSHVHTNTAVAKPALLSGIYDPLMPRPMGRAGLLTRRTNLPHD